VINRDFADVKTTMAGMGYAVMGTAQRSGQNRAMEAAMAAMASPLLEAGAIDGARGILINITGSSNLKLSEVNEASGIIQNAAHEDANIIFGAVQDEAMGDEVKITVIATGFKQQEMPQRRERMLAEATLPTMRYDVPIQPRTPTPRAAAPRFASEMEFEVTPTLKPMDFAVEPSMETQRSAGRVEESVAPELVPVPASVFDDDFFQSVSGPGEGQNIRGEGVTGRFRDTNHLSAPIRVQQEGVFAAEPVTEPGVRGTSFSDAVVVSSAEQAESDELDIPAFLRRGN
jgi:cell division protein FtsZ